MYNSTECTFILSKSVNIHIEVQKECTANALMQTDLEIHVANFDLS